MAWVVACGALSAANAAESAATPRQAFEVGAIKSIMAQGATGEARAAVTLKEIGKLKIDSRRLLVIDPGFMHPVRLAPLVRAAPAMEARVQVASITTGENKGMPAFILVAYGDVEKAMRAELAERTALTAGERQGYIGIDSGELCIIDDAQVPRGDAAAMRSFGERIIGLRGPNEVAIIDPKKAAFVVAKSGNGDGAYPCYWLMDAKGDSVALLVDFENWR